MLKNKIIKNKVGAINLFLLIIFIIFINAGIENYVVQDMVCMSNNEWDEEWTDYENYGPVWNGRRYEINGIELSEYPEQRDYYRTIWAEDKKQNYISQQGYSKCEVITAYINPLDESERCMFVGCKECPTEMKKVLDSDDNFDTLSLYGRQSYKCVYVEDETTEKVKVENPTIAVGCEVDEDCIVKDNEQNICNGLTPFCIPTTKKCACKETIIIEKEISDEEEQGTSPMAIQPEKQIGLFEWFKSLWEDFIEWLKS